MVKMKFGVQKEVLLIWESHLYNAYKCEVTINPFLKMGMEMDHVYK